LPEIPHKPKEISSRFRSRLSCVERSAAYYFCGNVIRGMTTSKEARVVTASSGHALEILWEDGEFILSRSVWDGEGLPSGAPRGSLACGDDLQVAKVAQALGTKLHAKA
jgi:hypothetical protein